MLEALFTHAFADSTCSANSSASKDCHTFRPAARHTTRQTVDTDILLDKSGPKPKCRCAFTNLTEHYCIIIKPKICRSRSLTDLTVSDHSELLLDYKKAKSYFARTTAECAGDAAASVPTGPGNTRLNGEPMSFSRNLRPMKKTKRRSDDSASVTYASNFANEYIEQSEGMSLEATTSGFIENPCLDTDPSHRAFPFKPTPSGNLKVQSNQVVFQSPTVGVLLADPTQAKVKVKFEGKSSDEPTLDQNTEHIYDPEYLYGRHEARNTYIVERAELKPSKSPPVKDDKAKDLATLGYSMCEPVDWSRVQLPKKNDLYQEFYRRIHNYINTDILVHIGDDEFHCHLIVLQAYSNYFDKTSEREVELPVRNVTPQAFQTIYDWMIFCGSESHKLLKRDNILDLFCAAQYLAVKDLEEQCWSFIVNEDLFTEDTAFALFQEARLKGITPVMELMVPRVMRFFLPLVASRDFLQLTAEEIMVFLRSNYICVTSEIEVMMAAVRWLYGDWPNRRKLVTEVMRCVRFGLISPWQLVDVKRNRDNPEILEVIQEPEVQHMVDDGLAYVIIKYWYGNNSKNYYHWIDVLGLVEPAERNWIGEEKNHVSYKDFLKYLEQFLVPRDQAYQLLAMQQPARRNEDIIPGSMRSGLMDPDKMDMRRPKLDFPLPATLKGLTDKDKNFPTMSEFFESRKKAHDAQTRLPHNETELNTKNVLQVQQVLQDKVRRRTDSTERHSLQSKALQEQQALQNQIEQQKQHLQQLQEQHMQLQQINQESASDTLDTEGLPSPEQQAHRRSTPLYEPAEKDASGEELDDKQSVNSDSSTDTNDNLKEMHDHKYPRRTEKRHSVAASYLAAATAALAGAGSSRLSQQNQLPAPRLPTDAASSRGVVQDCRDEHERRFSTVQPSVPKEQSPHISLFNQSKEVLARLNMNKLSNSILGPSNKNYIAEGSLFNWDRETVLVFGGIDPHTAYGMGRNTGRDIYRFDPVANLWEYVGELPEPRHHHSVAFLRGRVYLVGGADPRDDDIRGKSVVVSTVWSYEPVTRSWFSESGLAVPRKNFGLVVHRMALYAIGGQDKKGRVIRSVERFDPKTGTWSEVRPMSVARMGVACTKYREYIWVAGGMTGDRKKPLCRIVECYNSKTNEWTEINNLRFPRCFATLFSMNDKLYLLGGAGRVAEKEKTTSSVGAIDVWDWKDRDWKLQTEMSIPRHGHALAYLGTQLIIIGGVTTIYMRALSNVESFCCERMAWIRGVAALPSPLSGHGAVTLPPASLM